jgi:hypothetical protein
MLNKLLVSVLLTAVPIVLVAQTVPISQHEPIVKTKVKGKKMSKSRVELNSTAVQMAAGIEAAEAALTPEEMAIAELVYQGKLPCELGAFVTLTADPKLPGYFDLQIKNVKYRMFPVVSSTGAIRLEDQKAGAVWLQLSNKSMLMNQKLGQRLADECMSPDQAMVAEANVKNPAPSLFDAPAAPTTK